MADTASNIIVQGSGFIASAPLGSTLPTTTAAALAAPFVAIGYVDDTGVTESQPTESNKIKAWQNGDIVRIAQTSHELTYQFTALETSDGTTALFYGNGTRASAVINGDVLAHHMWVIDVLDGDDVVRICIPDGQVTERGEVKYVNGEVASYPMTITCYPDASGNKAYKYVGAAA